MFSFISRFKVRTQLAALLLVFGMLPVMAVMPLVMSKLDDMRQARLSSMQEAGATVLNVIDRNLFERYGDVQAFALNPAARSGAVNGVEHPLVASMNGYMTNYGMYKLMMLLDAEGNVLATNSISATGTLKLLSRRCGRAKWARDFR